MRRLGPRRVWVTRTQPQADATARRLVAMGLEPATAPVLVAGPVAADIDLAGVGALAFTSAAAVRAFADAAPGRDLPVFAVGEATAEAARAAGFTDVRAARGDVRALADRIAAAEPPPALVLAPTAREPAADLPALLAARGVRARGVVVYETRPVRADPPAGVDAVLIHSARAAQVIAELVAPDLAACLSVFAISEAAAAPLRFLPFAAVVVAPFPDEAGLLQLLKPVRS
jgi:uroporphyrinogen-III synthase